MTEQLNLVEIVSRHVLLQQSRKALKGRCPFHKDETTSLMVIPASNVFKCFGCGAEGGPIEFMMAIEGKTRNEIIAKLASKNFPAAKVVGAI
ncbi:CHC2 zinc finger domain-containing protein [Mucilaginibacter litoreus]|uniref:CHC2 zinc finger domain-containing protein n=1 Tax=Mucilaginibacter litoreus TaxID=1048221 RepID=A0ABW3ARC7_9SPHI